MRGFIAAVKTPGVRPQGRHRTRCIPWPDRLALLAMMLGAVFVVFPLFDPGYPSSLDGAAHFVRLKAMAEIFLPNGRTDGWCPYWYNGFVPFLFYPNLFFVLAGGVYHASARLVPLLLIFKVFMASAYALLPPAMYIMARCYRFTRFAALCAALCTLAVSAPHGIGLEALFVTGLIPHGFALPLFLLALGAFHLGVTLGGRFVPVAAILCALVVGTHFISGIYLALASSVYLIIAFLRHRRPRRTIQRAMWIGILTAGISAATVLPMVVHRSLGGPGTRWADFAFFRDFLQGRYLGGRGINWLAVAFVGGIRRWRFEETFLVVLALVTLPFALGVIPTVVPIVENDLLIRILRSRGFSFLGLLVALFAGGASDAIRGFAARHSQAMVSWLVAGCLGALLLLDAGFKIEGLKHHVKVDDHYNMPEKWQYLDAYQWVREHAPRPAVIGFDDRLKEFGNPGYYQMASRVVLEADRFSLPGNQIEATRVHNEAVLIHLHDWDPSRIHDALVRYNVSFLLAWVADVGANLQHSSDFALVYRNAKVQVWAVQGHDFRFVSGHAIQVGGLDFSPERITWTITCTTTGCPVTLAVAYHPSWRARLNSAATPIRETQDHLIQVQIPRGTSTLTLVFRRAWWEYLAVAISVTFLGLSLSLCMRGRRRNLPRKGVYRFASLFLLWLQERELTGRLGGK